MSAQRWFLVLGGSGQLGTALVRELDGRGDRVVQPPPSEVDLLQPGLGTVIERRSPTASPGIIKKW